MNKQSERVMQMMQRAHAAREVPEIRGAFTSDVMRNVRLAADEQSVEASVLPFVWRTAWVAAGVAACLLIIVASVGPITGGVDISWLIGDPGNMSLLSAAL